VTGQHVTGPDGGAWWRALPAAETWVPCGDGTHPIRWEDGQLSLPGHGDPEAEAVLAALGGEKAACLEVAEAWHRHAADLSVLAVGPRDAGDDVGVSWEDVEEFRANRLGSRYARRRPGGGMVGSAGPLRAGGPVGGRVGSRPMIPAGGALGGFGPAGRSPELERLRTERLELLTLLALGPAFHLILSGLVAASFAPGGSRAAEVPDHRPALEVAVISRLARAAEAWLGVDPNLVDVRLAGDSGGWGELELVGSGAGLGLQGALPVSWLASVWAPGLALVGAPGLAGRPGQDRRHLVVAVERAAYPEATVLALPAPGRDPVRLTVRASDADGPGPWAHWEITDDPSEGAAT
jgi:hypothetical protein